MPHRLYHIFDTVLWSVTGISALASSTVLLAQASLQAEASKFDSLSLLLLPLIGALIMSGGMIMLNPEPEKREKTIGRGIISLFFGACLPSVIALIHPHLKIITEFPVLLLAVGGSIAALTYILSRPLVEKLYQRSAQISEEALDKLQQRYGINVAMRDSPFCAECPDKVKCSADKLCQKAAFHTITKPTPPP